MMVVVLVTGEKILTNRIKIGKDDNVAIKKLMYGDWKVVNLQEIVRIFPY